MKQFYELVLVDEESLRFYAKCSICGRKQYAAKLPILCRGIRTLARCKNGKANRLSQSAFNHRKAASVQLLAICFNQCRHCFRWVCDDCYDIDHANGACRNCSQSE